VFSLLLSACGDSPESLLSAAKQQMGKSDFRAAVINIKTVLQKEPTNLTARMMLAKAYLAVDAHEDAAKELLRAREQGGKDEEVLPMLMYAWLHSNQAKLALEQPDAVAPPVLAALVFGYKAQAYLSQGNRTEAENMVRFGLQADARSVPVLVAQAEIQVMDKRQDLALETVEAALKVEPERLETLYLKAGMLRQLGRQTDAGKVLEQIVSLNPMQFRAHLELAQIAIAAENLEGAEKAVAAAEKIAAKSVLTQYTRGLLELRRNNPKKAEEVLSQVVSQAPEYVPALVAQAMAYMGLNQPELAMKAARSVLSVSPGNDAATRIMAAAQAQVGDSKGAFNTLTPLKQANPDDALLGALANAVRYKPHEKSLGVIREKMKQNQPDQALQELDSLAKALPNDALPYNLRGAILASKNDMKGSRAAFEKALALQPNSYAAAYYLGRMDVAENNLEAARKRFEKFLEADKTNSQAMLALAELAAARNQEQAYVDWLERALKAQPRSFQVRARLANYLLGKRETKKAMELAQEGAALRDSPESNGLLGDVRMATGDVKGAIVSYTRAAEKSKDAPQAYVSLAMAQAANKDLEQSRANLVTALKVKPGYVPALEARIALEMGDKKFDDALRAAKELQAAQPKAALGHEREGDVQLARSLFPEAARAYETALGLQAATPVLVKLHTAMIKSGKGDEAEKKLVIWLKDHPKDLAARAYAAEKYSVAGKRRDAITQYEAILAVAPDRPAELNNLAVLYQQEKSPKALATAEKALKLAPKAPPIQDTVGWILVESGQIKRGLPLIQSSFEANPKDPSVHYHLAAALAKSGDKVKAKAELEKLLASKAVFQEAEAAKALMGTL
jgi:tetratricopeptide (TPR) repeat protein